MAASKPQRGGEQRLGNSRSDHGQGRVLGHRDRLEAVHDAPDGPEQAHERRRRADGGERREVPLERSHLAVHRQFHDTPDTAHQALVDRWLQAARCLAPFFDGGGEHHRHRVIGALGEVAIELIERSSRPKGLFEHAGAPFEADQPRTLVENDGPAPQGSQQQQEHHRLDDDVRLHDQRPKAVPGGRVGEPHGIDRGLFHGSSIRRAAGFGPRATDELFCRATSCGNDLRPFAGSSMLR